MTISRSSRSLEWQLIRRIETIQATLSKIEGRLKVIRAHAWHESGNYDEMFEQATATLGEVRLVHELINQDWAAAFECLGQ